MMNMLFINATQGDQMDARNIVIALSLVFSAQLSMPAWAGDGNPFPQEGTFTTLVITTLNIEA